MEKKKWKMKKGKRQKNTIMKALGIGSQKEKWELKPKSVGVFFNRIFGLCLKKDEGVEIPVI